MYSIERLRFLCERIPPLLEQIDPAEFSHKPSPEKWSKKQIIGHLIDSAANNHQRFVRGQFEEMPQISYDQDKWNAHSYHQEIDGQQIIEFWWIYNIQLAEIVSRIPEDKLQRKVKSDGEKVMTIQALFDDYIL